jgi:hypothetical protein
VIVSSAVAAAAAAAKCIAARVTFHFNADVGRSRNLNAKYFVTIEKFHLSNARPLKTENTLDVETSPILTRPERGLQSTMDRTDTVVETVTSFPGRFTSSRLAFCDATVRKFRLAPVSIVQNFK